MRGKIGIMAAVILLAGLLGGVPVSAAGFGVSGVTAFTVDGDSALVNTARTELAAGAAALETLLNEGKTPEANPLKAEKIAGITAEFTDGRRAEFVISMDDNGMYASMDGAVIEISADAFHRLLNVFGNSLYKYRAVPSASIRGESFDSGALYVSKTSYAYKKLDKKFYRPYFQQKEISYIMDPSKGAWPSLTFSIRPEAVSVSVFGSSPSPVFTGSWEEAGEYLKKNPAPGHAVITATYQHEMYRGAVEYSFGIDGGISKSGDKFTIEGNNTYPGEVMVIRVSDCAPGEQVGFSSDIQFTPNFFDDGEGGKIALMPVSYFTAVGEHTITLKCGGESVKWGIAVNNKKFQIQNLTVDSSVTSSTIEDQKANAEYETAIAPLRPVADSKQYWDTFVWPVTGPVSTEFGMIRYVNGAPTSSRHGAIDFAVPRGTEVKAAAAGRVLHAGFLQLTGNTVLIEHGYGLKSWYYHMDSLNVKTGDMVKASQIVGKVGSTGFSTGPHLHFGMSVNNVFINPSTVIDTDLLK